MDNTMKDKLRLFAVGFGTAGVFTGMLLLLREWDTTAWIIKAIYIALMAWTLSVVWQALFRPCKPSSSEKEHTNAGSKPVTTKRTD